MPMGTHPTRVAKHPCRTRKRIASFFIAERMPTHNKGILKKLLKYILETTHTISTSQQGFEPSHDPPLLSGSKGIAYS